MLFGSVQAADGKRFAISRRIHEAVASISILDSGTA
jgi:hypothetical protein